MITVTYTPPAGEDRSVVYFGVEFFANRPEEIDPAEHPLLVQKVGGNALFTVTDGASDDAPARRRGRPPKDATEDAA